MPLSPPLPCSFLQYGIAGWHSWLRLFCSQTLSRPEQGKAAGADSCIKQRLLLCACSACRLPAVWRARYRPLGSPEDSVLASSVLIHGNLTCPLNTCQGFRSDCKGLGLRNCASKAPSHPYAPYPALHSNNSSRCQPAATKGRVARHISVHSGAKGG